MKVQIKLNETTIIEAEADSTRELLTKISELQQVFSYNKCGLCGHRVRFVHSEAQGFHFFECRCTDTRRCGARLRFGQPKQEPDRLFPQLKDAKTGTWKPNDGWEIYRPGQANDQHQHGPSDDQYQQQGPEPQYEA
jgi:hypothetical protein